MDGITYSRLDERTHRRFKRTHVSNSHRFKRSFLPVFHTICWCWETTVGFGVGDVVGVDVDVVGDVGVARMPHHLLLGVGHG